MKTVQMEIPILISRSGLPKAVSWRQAGLTLIGRARGKRFTVLQVQNGSSMTRDVQDTTMMITGTRYHPASSER